METKKPIIQRRLDFWLISSTVQEEVEDVDIIPAIRTDHSAITMHINGLKKHKGVRPIGNLIPVF